MLRLVRFVLVGGMLALAADARAQNVTGTWTLGVGEFARCRAVLTDGTRLSSSYGLGPLEISQSGSAIYVRSAGRALRYEGILSLTAAGGAAFATSCDAVTANPTDVPGTFHFGKLTPDRHRISGTFVGRWQNSDDILICRFSAERTDGSDPGLAACP